MAVEPNPIRKAFQEAAEKTDTKFEKIDSGLGVDLWCRVLRAKEQSAFAAKCNDRKTGQKFRDNYGPEYLSLCLCDDKGKLLFPGENGVIDLSNFAAHTLDKPLEECHRVNKVSRAERKNSDATESGDSFTDSPQASVEP